MTENKKSKLFESITRNRWLHQKEFGGFKNVNGKLYETKDTSWQFISFNPDGTYTFHPLKLRNGGEIIFNKAVEEEGFWRLVGNSIELLNPKKSYKSGWYKFCEINQENGVRLFREGGTNYHGEISIYVAEVKKI